MWVGFVFFLVMGVNCFVLDELMNYFDLEVIEEFETVFEIYDGCFVVVIYDCRFFEWLLVSCMFVL